MLAFGAMKSATNAPVKYWKNSRWLLAKSAALSETAKNSQGSQSAQSLVATAGGTESVWKASVLVPFYNKLDYLEKVLVSLETQTERQFEVVICDDGSRKDVTDLLMPLLENSPLAIQYVWHEDLGFRKNRILNHGINIAQSDFLIFIDGDCIQHPHFVQEHLSQKKPKTVLSGRRVELSPWITRLLTPQKIREGYLGKNLWWILLAICHRKHAEAAKGIYLKDSWLRRFLNRRARPLVGCNFAGNRIDFENVNGFDIRYEGIGAGEDSDIDFRLGLSGVSIQSMVHAAVQYHLWHPFLKRPSLNEGMFAEVIAARNSRAVKGLEEMKLESKNIENESVAESQGGKS